jgi:hypothetical protein
MSTRSIRDYVNRAFFARDKASLAAVADEAESAFPPKEEGDDGAKQEHNEPKDGEGDDADHSGHVGGVHVHIEHGKQGAADATAARLQKIEDSVAALTKTVGRVADAVGIPTKAATKDEDGDDDRMANLRKARAAQGQGAGESEAEEGEGEGGEESKEKPDFIKAKDTDPEAGSLGAAEALLLKAAEPELMNADPSLRTGRSDMGDATHAKKVRDAFALVVRDAAARAEVLHPGSRMPTIDTATLDAAAATKRLCAFRRGALLGASKSSNGRKAIGRHTGDDIRRMSCDAVRILFDDASAKMWHVNNDSARTVNESAFQPPDLRSYRSQQAEQLRAINDRNNEFWGKQQGRPN